jgi:hypothetical protein
MDTIDIKRAPDLQMARIDDTGRSLRERYEGRVFASLGSGIAEFRPVS